MTTSDADGQMKRKTERGQDFMTKGSNTLEARAREFEKMCLYTPSVPGDEWNRDLALQFATDFARTVAREMIAELRKEAERLILSVIPSPDRDSRVSELRYMAERLESSPRYGAGTKSDHEYFSQLVRGFD
jgi:hypothetical protein